MPAMLAKCSTCGQNALANWHISRADSVAHAAVETVIEMFLNTGRNGQLAFLDRLDQRQPTPWRLNFRQCLLVRRADRQATRAAHTVTQEIVTW